VALEDSAELWDVVGVLVWSPGCVGEVSIRAGVQQGHRRCRKWLGWSEGVG
jgi:hypothetical protein